MNAQHKIRRADPPNNIFTEEEGFQMALDFLQTAKKPLIAIVGSTASGKTDLSLRLARKCHGEVINTDSRQFYKGMDIGTAKITPEEMDGVPHHLLSFLSPDEECTVAVFKSLAEEKIQDILRRKKIPFLVGGSGLFVDTLRKNFTIPRVPPQRRWRQTQDHLSSEELYEKLKKTDPEVAEKMSPQNRSRILRALEVIKMTGKKMSQQQSKENPLFDTLLIGVWRDPEELEKRIEKRTEILWNSGFLEEVKSLLKKGYTEETPAMIAHGYREAMQFLKGEISEEEAKYLMTRNTRRYAKRQRTWWRREKDMVWVGI